MDLLRLLGRRGLARADGPYGFVGDDQLAELFRCEVVNHLFDLRLHHVEMFAGLAFVEVLAYAVDRNEVVGIGLLHLAVERLGGLAVVLAALRVAQDHVLTAQRRDHRRGYFARVGPFGLGGAVLGADGDSRPFERLAHLRQVREGRTYDERHAVAYGVLACCDLLGQFYAFGRQGIHFPVACYDLLSHCCDFLSL